MGIIKNGEQLKSISYNKNNKKLTIVTIESGSDVTTLHTVNSDGCIIQIKEMTGGNGWQIWMEDGMIGETETNLEMALKEGLFDLNFKDDTPLPGDFSLEYVGIVEIRDARTNLINFKGSDDYKISMHLQLRGTGSEQVEYHIARVLKVS